MCGQLGDEPIRQRLDRVVLLLLLLLDGFGWRAADRDDRALKRFKTLMSTTQE
jgi:hypothetical protein